MSLEQDELLIDQETFITKLALEILEGRSFDVTGKKCSYEMLFNNVVAPDSDPEEEEEAEDPAPVQDKFIDDMLIKVDRCYERLRVEEMVRVKDFRKAIKGEGYRPVEQIAMYRKDNNIDAQCKSILAVINDLQQNFKDVNRLDRVTTNLERLSKVVSFVDKQ